MAPYLLVIGCRRAVLFQSLERGSDVSAGPDAHHHSQLLVHFMILVMIKICTMVMMVIMVNVTMIRKSFET